MYDAQTLLTLNRESRSLGGQMGVARRAGEPGEDLTRALAVNRVKTAVVTLLADVRLDTGQVEEIVALVRQAAL